jgi:hypothetical protein
MAFVLAPEVAEGGLAVGEELLPEIEDAIPKMEEEEPRLQKTVTGGSSDTSLRDLFLYRSMQQQQQQQPVVINNNNNNNFPNQPAAEPTTPTRQTVAEALTKPSQLTEEKKVLENQEKIISELKEQASENPQNKTVVSTLQDYVKLYQRNLSIFQSQLDQTNSIFEQSKNYRFY